MTAMGESGSRFSADAALGPFEELKLADRLPSPPGLCLSLLGLDRDGRNSADAVVDCIRLDSALTGRLIKLANQSRAVGTPPATTARQAAARLDPAAVRGVASSFSLVSRDSEEACDAFDLRRHWTLSLACAAAAEALTRRFGTGDPEEAFTLGLVCQVGVLAMATVHPEEFSGVLKECEGCGPDDLQRCEVRTFRIHHDQVTADILADWGLPEEFRAPVLTLSRSAPEARREDTANARSSPLLKLALDMAEQMVDCASPLPLAEAPEENAEMSLARAEAIRRWRGLVAQCGIEAKPSRSQDEARPGPEPQAEATGSREGRLDANPASPAPAAERAGVGKATRVLVVDDDPGARHLIGLHLKRAGYEVITAQDGESGLRAALSESPQLVITDWMMPGLSGLELCRALRRVEVGRKMYLLLLTSREEEDSVVEGLEAGANDYVTKPFNPRILLARVHAGQRVIDLQRQVEVDQQVDRRRSAEMAQLSRKLRNVADMDVLTELHNRRYAMRQLEEAWRSAARYDRPLSVVMIDLDHFKKINDQFGHLVGDVVLRATADVLRAKTRRNDVVCRLGGEEFLVICINGGLEGGLACARRLHSALDSNEIVHPAFEGKVTASLGVAERTAAMRGVDDLLAAADLAVYDAKAQGRNRVCWSGPSPDQALSA